MPVRTVTSWVAKIPWSVRYLGATHMASYVKRSLGSLFWDSGVPKSGSGFDSCAHSRQRSIGLRQ